MKTVKPIPAKLIEMGWGSSGYYSEAILRRDGPSAFPKGTLMFLNHATKQQLRERPEGDMKDLAAVLVSDPVYDPDGGDGPGLYSSAKPFSDYARLIAEKGPYTGLSIFAQGPRKWGKAEGREGYIVTAIKPSKLNSVDIVARAGANGKFLIESAAVQDGYDLLEEKILIEDTDMGDEAKEQLREALAENSRLQEESNHLASRNTELLESIRKLQEKNNKLEASHLIDEAMREEYDQLSEATQRLISNMVTLNLPVLEDGSLDSSGVRREVAKIARPFLREGEKESPKRMASNQRLAEARVYGQGSGAAIAGELLSEGSNALEYLNNYLGDK